MLWYFDKCCYIIIIRCDIVRFRKERLMTEAKKQYYFRKDELSEMSDDELKEIAKEKSKKGKASYRATQCQKELWEREDRPFARDHVEELISKCKLEDEWD